MMKAAKEQDRKRILQYLKPNVQECLYLYVDITNYGIVSSNMQVWYAEEDGELLLVAMKYFDSYQIYSHKIGYGMDEFYQLFKENLATMISGRKDLIEQLARKMPDYTARYGIVFRIMPSMECEKGKYNILRATEEDTLDIAKMVCADNGFGLHYTVEGLQAQLAERIRAGTGRSYFVRAEDTNEVMAHSASFAETEDVAILSGNVVSPKYRKTDIFMELDNYVRYQMGKEQKEMFALTTSRRMIYLQKLLDTSCGEYGKLVRKRQ